MADTATLNGALTARIAGTDINIGISKGSASRNLSATPEATAGIDTLSTGFLALSFGAVGDNEITLLGLENLSTTTGEDITIAKQANPQVGSGSNFVLDGTPTQAGGSVPNTLTGAGYYRKIISPGTSQGITWDTGDIAVYLGSSGVWGRIPAVEFLLLRGNDVVDYAFLPIKADSNPVYAKAATGTPRMANVAVGALA